MNEQALNDVGNSHLGELVAQFEETSKSTTLLVAGIACAGIVVGICLGGFATNPIWIILNVVLAGISTLVVGHFVVKRFGRSYFIRQFENGVQFEEGDENKTLYWEDLHNLTADWTHTYVNGVYSGTSVEMAFTDKLGRGVTYNASPRRGDEKYDRLEQLRCHASDTVFKRMIVELLETGRVHWASTLTITNDGIEHVTARIGEPEFYPFERVTNWKIGNGELKICLDGCWLSTTKIRSSAENFYPGLQVLQSLMAARKFRPMQEALVAGTSANDLG